MQTLNLSLAAAARPASPRITRIRLCLLPQAGNKIAVTVLAKSPVKNS